MALKLYSSNKLEKLAELFHKNIYNQQTGNIFLPEQVVVQTGGMELFLRKYLAQNAGIAANLETPFLNRFISGTMRALLTAEEYEKFQFSSVQYSPDVLKWHICDELTNNASLYPEAAQYAATPEFCYQLSAQLAKIFDRYIWYQHKKLFSWRQKPEINIHDHWEKNLYLNLNKKLGSSPDCFFNEIQNLSFPANKPALAPRYSLFGIGAIPPVLLDFCKKLAEFTDIYLFYLNPSQAYWGDMKSNFQLRWEARKANSPEPELQINNPLLANLGTWGRDFFENTLDIMDGTPGEESFAEPEFPDKKLLHRVQQDILDSFNRTLEKDLEQQAQAFAGDRSISIHNCHSCRREVEVLHDQLLLAMDELQIRPNDIIVMAPDINTYAPYIESVFSSGKLANSYGISDRSLTTVSSTAENLLQLLELHSARCTAAEIYSLLNTPAIRENFELDDTCMETIKNFITSSGISWGADGEARAEFSAADFEEFSWQEGFDRLLLGYAASESQEEKLQTRWTPAGSTSSTQAELLGKFITIVNKLFECRRFFRLSHTAAEWISFLEETIDFLYGRAYSRKNETEFIRRSLNNWLKTTEQAEFKQKISIKTLKQELNGILDGMNDTRGYLTRGITFCSLVPMRSIPAKVIAVLGLKSKDFPRKDVKSGLNIFPAVRGERSRLLEDRYLFLETILAARERLLLFYPGQGADDKASVSPSAPLADLLKYLSDCFGFKETTQFRHGHAEEYFTSADPNRCSYSEHFCEIARKIQSRTTPPESKPEYSGSSVIETDGSVKKLIEYKISDLAWILNNPLKIFLKHAFGLDIHKEEKLFSQETELLKVDFSEDTIREILQGKTASSDLYKKLERNRELPPGENGNYLFTQQYSKIAKIISNKDDLQQKLRRSEKILLDVFLDGKYRIYGMIWQNQDSGAQIYFSKYENSKAHLEGYLNHLVNAVQTGGQVRDEDSLFLQNRFKNLSPISKEEARNRLLQLLELAQKAQTVPLPLFPQSSWEFAQTGDLSKAIDSFLTNDAQDPYCLEVFGENPFESENFVDEFQKLACLVYQPWSQAAMSKPAEEEVTSHE